jgi:5-methylcytosine-specific restriction endonuclease McrA
MSEYTRALAKADKAFSAYIRARDDDGSGHFRCPTCGRYLPIEQADAGHIISRREMGTRFDEMNVWAQCRECNRFHEGRHALFLRWLENKIGAAEADNLLARSQIRGGYTAYDLQLLAEEYRKKSAKEKEK